MNTSSGAESRRRLAPLARALGAELRRRWQTQPGALLLGGGATLAYLLRLLLDLLRL